MTPDTDRPGWFRGHYADLFSELDERAGERIDLPVLSVTKSRGPMLASERFGKVMHGRDLSRYRRAPKDHVVADPMLLWDGSIGLQSVVDLGLVSPDYRVYAPTTKADPLFAGFLVRSPAMLPFYQGGARGTNVRRNRIARSDFLGIPVGIPPLPEQCKIAAILSSVDEAIEGTRAVIDQLQVVKKAMMADLLTRGIPGRHKTFKQTEIGEVPADWEVVTLAVLCAPDGLQTGPFGSQLKASEYTPDGIPVVMPKDLVGGRISTDTVARVPESRATDLAHHCVRPGDVLFARRGDIGRCALVREHERGWLCGTGCLRARPGKTVHPEFLAAFFAHEIPIQWLTEHAVGQTMLNLNTEILGAVPVALPLLPEQEVIASSLQIVDERSRVENDGLGRLRAIKSALMSVLLTGEVRVKVDEEAAA